MKTKLLWLLLFLACLPSPAIAQALFVPSHQNDLVDAKIVTSYTNLRAVKAYTPGIRVLVVGRSAINDGGAGYFYADFSDTTTADDGGIVLVGNTGTRWKRIFDGHTFEAAWYGLHSDGATDDSTAINAAITACNTAGGGRVLLPAKTQAIASSIPLLSNVSLEGSPSGQSVLKLTGDVDMITIGAVSNASVRYLTLDGNSANFGGTNRGIYASATPGGYSNISVDHCTVKNTSYIGIAFSAQTSAHGTNVHITNNTVLSTGGHGILCQDFVDDCTITGNYVKYYSLIHSDTAGITANRSGTNLVIGQNTVICDKVNALGASVHGISVDTATGATVSNNMLVDCIGYSIEVTKTVNSAVTGNTIIRPYRAGIALTGKTQTSANNYGVTVTGNSIYHGSTQGIYSFIASPDGVLLHHNTVITGNTIDTCTLIGIQIDNTVGGVISDNSVENCGNSGIKINANSTTGFSNHLAVQNNHLYNNNTANVSGDAGLRIDFVTGAQDDFLVSGNHAVANGVVNQTFIDTGTPTAFITSTANFITANNVAPWRNNTVTLGTSSSKWSEVYGIDGNFNGATIGTVGFTNTGPVTWTVTDQADQFVWTGTNHDPTVQNTWLDLTGTLAAGATAMTAVEGGASIVSQLTGTGGTSGSGAMIGATLEARNSQTTGTVASVVGASTAARNQGAGTATIATSVQGIVINSGAGVVATANAQIARTPTNSGGGSITTAIGQDIQDQSLTGSTTSYALKLENQTQGNATNAYGIFSGTGPNVLGDTLSTHAITIPSAAATALTMTTAFTANAANNGVSHTASSAPGATAVTNPQYGYNLLYTVSGSGGANSNAPVRGFQTDIRVGQTAGTWVEGTGYNSVVRNTNAGLVSALNGFATQLLISSTGNVTLARGYYVKAPSLSSSGVAVTNRGVDIDNQGVSGMTTSAAINIANQSGSTTNYAILTGTGLHSFGGAAFGSVVNAPTYGATVTIDASLANHYKLTVTDGNAITMAAPTNPATGMAFDLDILNSSGGAMGAITWNAAFKKTTFTNPASTKRVTGRFYYDGSSWVQVGAWSGDI